MLGAVAVVESLSQFRTRVERLLQLRTVCYKYLTMAGPPRKKQKREGKEDGQMPQKKFYRQRAHANPFSDHDLT